MSRFTLIVLAGLWMGGQAVAGWADGLFDERARDFGSVPHGPMLQHSFRLTNNTKEVMQLGQVRVSCGCTSASALQTVLQPGESTSIVANMDSSRFYGFRRVTIFVPIFRPQWDEVHLTVQANSRSDMAITPDTLAFGKIQRGTAPSAKVNVSFMSPENWQVEDVRAESNYVKPAFKELHRANGDVTYELSATLRPDTPVGIWYTDLWLKTNNPSTPHIRVPLTVEVEPALNVNPKIAELGEVKTGDKTERKVIIQGPKPFRITDIQGQDSQLQVIDNSKDSKRIHILTLALKPAKPGELNWKLRILTDLLEETEVVLAATAKVLP
jgi:hypothetical protein